MNERATPDERVKLTTWLCERRNVGNLNPVITLDVISSTRQRPFLKTSERVRRAMLFFNKRIRLGETIVVYEGDWSPEAADESDLAALTECRTKEELIALVKHLHQMGYIEDTSRRDHRIRHNPHARWMGEDRRVRASSNRLVPGARCHVVQ